MRIDGKLVGLMEEEKRSIETEGKRRNKKLYTERFQSRIHSSLSSTRTRSLRLAVGSSTRGNNVQHEKSMKYIFPCHTAEEPSVLFCDETVSQSEVKSSEGRSEAIGSLVNANTSPLLKFPPSSLPHSWDFHCLF